jgi:hypothetical protein
MSRDSAARSDLVPLVLPRVRVVGVVLGADAAEQAAQVLGVPEILVDDRRGIRVVDDVLLELALGLQHVAE